MKSNEIRQSKSASWAGPTTLLAAEGAVGLWLWGTKSAYIPLGPAVGLLALTAALGAVWFYHIYASRRQFAIWNAYAEQELARAEQERQTPSLKSKRGISRTLV